MRLASLPLRYVWCMTGDAGRGADFYVVCILETVASSYHKLSLYILILDMTLFSH